MVDGFFSEEANVSAGIWLWYVVKTRPDIDDRLETAGPAGAQLNSLPRAKEFADVVQFNLFVPDGRFMDLPMPMRDDCETTRILRRLEADAVRALCPIIAISAHMFSEGKQKALDAGFSAGLTKHSATKIWATCIDACFLMIISRLTMSPPLSLNP
ncbi:hypothetical protein ACS3SW_02810 [Roseobacteraceae bacterium S113]